VRVVYQWLRDLVPVPGDPESIAREIALRGFEVASVEPGRFPVIDFEVTANRPDCLSHVGLAREASVIWGLPLQIPDVTMPDAGPAEPLDVHLEDPELCPRYCAQLFEVSVAQSPSWLSDRLQAAGVRPINNIVDITNYVMLEMGQPMHAFDLSRLTGRALVIRRARNDERLRTLDGVERALDSETLIIADAERAAALGGVMGGRDTEIGPETTAIALESAYFQPASVRRTSKRLGLKTEASIRFERGADINAPPAGIARAAKLLHQVGAGCPLGGLIDRYPKPKQPVQLILRASRITRVLGLAVPESDVTRILTALGFRTEAHKNAESAWSVTVPSFRVDATREIDLIEEVGRHYGFERLPAIFPALAAPQPPPDPRIARDQRIRHVLAAAGFSEAVTFAFIERQAALPFCGPGFEPVAIANPLSENFAVLRPSLLPGLLDSCAHNRRRERKDVRLFETGSRFTVDGGEGRAAAFAWCGAATGPHWSEPTRSVDFFDAKGVVKLICRAFGVEEDYAPAEVPFLVASRTAVIRIPRNSAQLALGVVGQVRPEIAEARGLPAGEEIFAAEMDLEVLGAAAIADDRHAAPLPRFPSIVRDISILVDEALPAAAVRGTIRSAAPETLTDIAEFDRYQGMGVPAGRISLSLRLTFRAPDRTLTDDEVQAATERIVEALRNAYGAERR
jgi:phenylalanyl-tRNA synthetase beta chain